MRTPAFRSDNGLLGNKSDRVAVYIQTHSSETTLRKLVQDWIIPVDKTEVESTN